MTSRSITRWHLSRHAHTAKGNIGVLHCGAESFVTIEQALFPDAMHEGCLDLGFYTAILDSKVNDIPIYRIIDAESAVAAFITPPGLTSFYPSNITVASTWTADELIINGSLNDADLEIYTGITNDVKTIHLSIGIDPVYKPDTLLDLYKDAAHNFNHSNLEY